MYTRNKAVRRRQFYFRDWWPRPWAACSVSGRQLDPTKHRYCEGGGASTEQRASSHVLVQFKDGLWDVRASSLVPHRHRGEHASKQQHSRRSAITDAHNSRKEPSSTSNVDEAMGPRARMTQQCHPACKRRQGIAGCIVELPAPIRRAQAHGGVGGLRKQRSSRNASLHSSSVCFSVIGPCSCSLAANAVLMHCAAVVLRLRMLRPWDCGHSAMATDCWHHLASN